ncbi:hypothetical protein [Streptomyces sp. NPDC018031]|uniref:hypothetical protein n=1 Tax=Streptomyces sp. NPDC018031 TaxID=3365033 RepID=UPI0037A080D0
MPKPAAAAALLALALALAPAVAGTTGCGGPDRPHVEGPAPRPGRAAGPVYVSDVLGHPLRRPTELAVTEHTSLSGLGWRSWGRSRAVATGRVYGTWCMPGCPSSGYRATVELTGLRRQENVSYYTRATVRSAHLPAEQAAGLRRLALPAPAP